nr:hypothetical protein BaRGS_013803 [Batillaria attramentaria]
MLDHGMIGAQPGAGRREAVVGTEIEASYLAYPRLQHMDDAPNEFRSRVVLISPPNQVHKVGDKIQFRVDLYDLRGKAREGGGDEVRAWLTTPLLPNTAVAAHVTDLGNGSYVAETILKWTGLTLVRVALTYPREFLRALVELRHELHTTRWITAIFNNRNGSQEAPWLNATLTFAPHARPFNVGAKQGGLHTLSIKEALRALPNNTNHIIVLHYFMHFSLYPLSVFRDRVRAARQAIQDLLETRPEVKILIRGPHVLFGGRGFHAILGDNFGPWYIDVLKKEFKGLYDKVWFLDFWDMSIAAVNRSAHPPTATILQMLKVLFGHIC